jgi:hypothetical protein
MTAQFSGNSIDILSVKILHIVIIKRFMWHVNNVV